MAKIHKYLYDWLTYEEYREIRQFIFGLICFPIALMLVAFFAPIFWAILCFVYKIGLSIANLIK